MNKKKPDYTKFMRKPPSLRMSQSSETDRRQPMRGPVREEEIPWAEIVEECGPQVSECDKPVHPPITVEDEDEDVRPTVARRYGLLPLAASRLWNATPLAGPPGLPLPAFLIVLVLLFLMV